jgi:hypothetical protein
MPVDAHARKRAATIVPRLHQLACCLLRGQSRRTACAPMTSGLPRQEDNFFALETRFCCVDHYEAALAELINQKRSGKAIAAKPRPRGQNVVDLAKPKHRRRATSLARPLRVKRKCCSRSAESAPPRRTGRRWRKSPNKRNTGKCSPSLVNWSETRGITKLQLSRRIRRLRCGVHGRIVSF